jgi:UDP-N-acetylglucosamine--N-acetylmuramyl-(pentapeptide) pyrophosphoryl-undecaprenol N-acetylglucosamine transferase
MIGAGGFVAGPACWVAHRLGVPIVLINVDCVAGKANKLAGRWAQDIFLQFDEARPSLERFRASLHTVGCPLRLDFRQPNPQHAYTDLGLDPHKKILLVTGASSGAQRINESIIALLPKLADFATKWQIVHLTGNRHIDQVTAAYQDVDVTYTVLAYYDHMADLQGAADLLIGRSGAVSVAEYSAAGVPTICMPYPFHRDRHQYLNAGKLVEVGAAVMVDDLADPAERCDWLWEELEVLLRDDDKRTAMSQAARSVARPDAAETIARHLLSAF